VSVTVPLTTRLLTRALDVSVPESYISHQTAAELWGGLVPACSA
jgi:hypothetical protein